MNARPSDVAAPRCTPDGTCNWPPTTAGWSEVEMPPRSTPPRPRGMQPTDLSAFTEIGRAQLHRAILTGILAAKKLSAPEPLVAKALTEGRGLELVRHLEALKHDGGRP